MFISSNIDHLNLPEYFNSITDLYLPAEDTQNKGLSYPGPKFLQQSPELMDMVNFLLSEAKKSEELEFAVRLVYKGNAVIFRGHSIDSIEGKVFIFRRLPSYIPKIEQLGIANNILELLTNERLNSGGLVIVCGETGQGKSTTCAGAISYRLRKYGSFCLTIEDPVELPLHGVYPADNNKNGICYQTNVYSDGIEAAIKSSMRCYPAVSNSILFLGETRDAMMANEVLKVAANGHLVFTTFHGSDLITSLKRFISLAAAHKNSSQDEVRSIFASVFKLILHQKLIPQMNGKKKADIKLLFSASNNSSVSNRLRSGQLDMLVTEIQMQNLKISEGKSILSLD